MGGKELEPTLPLSWLWRPTLSSRDLPLTGEGGGTPAPTGCLGLARGSLRAGVSLQLLSTVVPSPLWAAPCTVGSKETSHLLNEPRISAPLDSGPVLRAHSFQRGGLMLTASSLGYAVTKPTATTWSLC